MRRHFLLVLVFVVGTINAQNTLLEGWQYIEIDSTKQMWGDWTAPEWLRYFGLDAGDVNNDGMMDIVSGRYIYHNPGGTMEGHWPRTVLDDNVDGILSMDVDGDPYADIIAMALPNLYWYEATNLVGTTYRRTLIGQVPATGHVNSQGFEKAQLIPGGTSEFVIAGNGDIYAVQVPKDANTAWKVKMICKNTSDEGIGLGDIDGDGDLDIAAGRRPEGEDEPTILVWYKNPGSIDILWSPIVVGESIHPIDRVEISDVNGDGKPDIIATEERYPGLEPDANFWWFGQEDLNNWSRHKITTQFSINNLDVTDFDKDGDIDLLTAEHKGEALELQLWSNDGKGTFKKTVIDTGKENHLGTQWVDLDADGDLDIIGAGWDKHQYMHVWRNDAIRTLKTGMLFKEHSWSPTDASDAGKFLRVGGKLDYKVNTDHFPKEKHQNGFISLGEEVDLTNAIGAEVIIERVQSHEDTKEFKVQWNDGKPILFAEPSLITSPATDYMFHANIRMPIPLTDLQQGAGNRFKFTVATDQSWDWPQNLIYGLVLRIYYGENNKVAFGVQSEVTELSYSNNAAPNEVKRIDYWLTDTDDIQKVTYVGLFEDVNQQGDGRYRQLQQRFHRGERIGTIGSSNTPPFKIGFDPEWVPDQQFPIKILGLATDKDGRTQVFSAEENLVFKRNHSVHLVKPTRQDPFWTTRNGEHSQQMEVPVELGNESSAMMYWNSWSPCYSEGLEINGIVQIPDATAPCYDAHWHEEPIAAVASLQKGSNELKTLKTPLHEGEMVHGMDVQWPGVMMKIKQPKRAETSVQISEELFEQRPHYIIHTKMATYYFDKAGGGFSRIIDQYGNDWVGYKTQPWDQYPASAASAFRGLPNLVFKSDTDSGAGHPGHDKCNSKIITENTIRTTTLTGLWEWEWTFTDDGALLQILKAEEGKPYWFLYEGTPGGRFQPRMSSYGTDATGFTSKTPDFFKGSTEWGQIQWAYFTKKEVQNTFFVAQLTPDSHMDMMSYLGNTEKGVDSPDGMTVFGFGRGKNTTPLLTGKNSFLIGWADYAVPDQEAHQKISHYIQSKLKQ